MRKYRPIWDELKNKGHCVITTHVKLHSRIVKAVVGEKDRDVGFKIRKAEDGKKVILKHVKNGAMIRFFLTEYSFDGKIHVEDL